MELGTWIRVKPVDPSISKNEGSIASQSNVLDLRGSFSIRHQSRDKDITNSILSICNIITGALATLTKDVDSHHEDIGFGYPVFLLTIIFLNIYLLTFGCWPPFRAFWPPFSTLRALIHVSGSFGGTGFRWCCNLNYSLCSTRSRSFSSGWLSSINSAPWSFLFNRCSSFSSRRFSLKTQTRAQPLGRPCWQKRHSVSLCRQLRRNEERGSPKFDFEFWRQSPNFRNAPSPVALSQQSAGVLGITTTHLTLCPEREKGVEAVTCQPFDPELRV